MEKNPIGQSILSGSKFLIKYVIVSKLQMNKKKNPGSGDVRMFDTIRISNTD